MKIGAGREDQMYEELTDVKKVADVLQTVSNKHSINLCVYLFDFFFLLQYSVLCTVESSSLLYLILYLDLYVLGDGSWISKGSSCKPNISLSWFISEQRVRLALWHCFKPSCKIFLQTFPRGCFFCGSFSLFMSCVFHVFLYVHCCLVITCWEKVDLLALVCDD